MCFVGRVIGSEGVLWQLHLHGTNCQKITYSTRIAHIRLFVKTTELWKGDRPLWAEDAARRFVVKSRFRLRPLLRHVHAGHLDLWPTFHVNFQNV